VGVNARFSDVESELVDRVTGSRESYDRSLRERIRAGEMSVFEYLTRYKGFSKEHAEKLLPRFEEAVFGPGAAA
jgi:hypothetical protein